MWNEERLLSCATEDLQRCLMNVRLTQMLWEFSNETYKVLYYSTLKRGRGDGGSGRVGEKWKWVKKNASGSFSLSSAF